MSRDVRRDDVIVFARAWLAAFVLACMGCGGGGEAQANLDLGGGIVMTPAGEILVSYGGASHVDRTSDTAPAL